MFEVKDDGSFLIKNSAVFGQEPVGSSEGIKQACHALSAHAFVAKLTKQAFLQELTQQRAFDQDDVSLRREALKTAAQKSSATSIEELENEVFASRSASQIV